MSQPQPKPPPPQLVALTQIANQLRDGIVNKTRNIAQFNDSLKNRIRVLDELSVQILQKIRDLCRRAVDCQQLINQRIAEIDDLTRRLQQATDAQAASVLQIQQLTEELNRAKNDAGQANDLRRQLAELQGQLQLQTEEIVSITGGIDAANAIIGQAVNQLNTPDDTAELQAMLSSLEAKITQLDQESNCGNNLPAPPAGNNGGPPGPGPGPKPRPPLFPDQNPNRNLLPVPPAKPGNGSSIVMGNGGPIQNPPMRFGKGGRKTKRNKKTFRKSRRSRR